MVKQTKVKWSIGSEEPDDLQEFLSNEEIEHKNGGRPPKGVYRFAVRSIKVREIKNGDNAGKPRLNAMLVVNEPKGSGNSMWNGYVLFDGFNVIDGPGLAFLKRFLRGLGVSWEDFVQRTKQDDQTPPNITQIGKVKFGAGQEPSVKATMVFKAATAEREEEMAIGRYLPLEDDVDEDEPEDDEDVEDMADDDIEDADPDEEDEDDDEDDEDSDEDDSDEEDEEDDDEDEDDEEEDEDEDLEAELQALTVKDLRERAVDNVPGAKAKKKMVDKVASMKKAALVALVVEQEADPV